MNIEEANAMFEWPTKHQVQNGLLTEKQINKQYGKVDVYVKSLM